MPNFRVLKTTNQIMSRMDPKRARRYGIYCLILALFSAFMTFALFDSARIPKGYIKTSGIITAVDCDHVSYSFSVSGQQYSFTQSPPGRTCKTPKSAIGDTETVYYDPVNPSNHPTVFMNVASGIIVGIPSTILTIWLVYFSTRLFSVYKKRNDTPTRQLQI